MLKKKQRKKSTSKKEFLKYSKKKNTFYRIFLEKSSFNKNSKKGFGNIFTFEKRKKNLKIPTSLLLFLAKYNFSFIIQNHEQKIFKNQPRKKIHKKICVGVILKNFGAGFSIENKSFIHFLPNNHFFNQNINKVTSTFFLTILKQTFAFFKECAFLNTILTKQYFFANLKKSTKQLFKKKEKYKIFLLKLKKRIFLIFYKKSKKIKILKELTKNKK